MTERPTPQPTVWVVVRITGSWDSTDTDLLAAYAERERAERRAQHECSALIAARARYDAWRNGVAALEAEHEITEARARREYEAASGPCPEFPGHHEHEVRAVPLMA